MRASQIRETFRAYFEARDHVRRPSASLVPSVHDPSVLLTTAGMQPLKPYFLGEESPPAPRLTTCQRCFRTTDIEEVGNTARHLTFFEMLGNFSFGDYFKEEAIGFGWELSLEGFGFEPERIWVTVFAGDEELGLGPDEEAIELWRAQGVPDERIVRLPRSENFWQAGATGPCGPCSEMYLDRGPEHGPDHERPGDPGERYLEYWNHVFMALELAPDGSLSELPRRNIDTGMGLERMAAILQDVDSVFETDEIRPLIALAEELSAHRYGEDGRSTRAMRILADHARGTVNLIADGVVPSNEDRGYVLRRIMRRAIQQTRVLGLEAPALGRFAERVIEVMGEEYPQVASEAGSIMRWVEGEEEGFGRTLERGTEMLEGIVARTRERGEAVVAAEDAFELHDTYGFPFEVTAELAGERGLGVDVVGFEALMDEQRRRARAGLRDGDGGDRERIAELASRAPPSRFVGYEALSCGTSVVLSERANGDGLVVKLEESPFYPEGGGQVSDRGSLRLGDEEFEVVGVLRIAEDQALTLPGAAATAVEAGARVEALVDRESRHATMRNHTATHLLHAALRQELGEHVRQAGSAVRPDKLRFDFTHGQPLTGEEVAAIVDRVNGWIKQSLPVRAIEMSFDEAERLGAMALFGEKYGDWVRVVEVDDVSRELCGGTHVANTAEVGLFEVVSEGSSAANVRRIEAVSGPAAIDLAAERREKLERVARALGSDDVVGGAERLARRAAELERAVERAERDEAAGRARELAEGAERHQGVAIVVARVDGLDQRALLGLADEIEAELSEAAIVLGGEVDGKVALVASLADQAVGRGLSAGDAVRAAADITGGGGGGRPSSAQAGGGDPARLDEALEVARRTLLTGLEGKG